MLHLGPGHRLAVGHDGQGLQGGLGEPHGLEGLGLGDPGLVHGQGAHLVPLPDPHDAEGAAGLLVVGVEAVHQAAHVAPPGVAHHRGELLDGEHLGRGKEHRLQHFLGILLVHPLTLLACG